MGVKCSLPTRGYTSEQRLEILRKMISSRIPGSSVTGLINLSNLLEPVTSKGKMSGKFLHLMAWILNDIFPSDLPGDSDSNFIHCLGNTTLYAVDIIISESLKRISHYLGKGQGNINLSDTDLALCPKVIDVTKFLSGVNPIPFEERLRAADVQEHNREALAQILEGYNCSMELSYDKSFEEESGGLPEEEGLEKECECQIE